MEMLLSQEGENFEIIVINDGSQDNTANIMKRYSDNEKVKYYEQQNQGVSSARNLGIQMATGEYLAFIDVDDELKQGFISEITYSINKKYDVIWLARYYVQSDSEYRRICEMDTGKIIASIVGADLIMDRNDYLCWSACSKAYRREFIVSHNILFDTEMRLGEDILFNCKVYSYHPSTCFIHKGYYRYIQNAESTSHSGWRESDKEWFNLWDNKIRNIESLDETMWNTQPISYWKKRFILDYGILIIGRVARAINTKPIKKQVEIIKEMTRYTEKARKQIKLNNPWYKDKVIFKLFLIEKFPRLYLIKFLFNKQNELDITYKYRSLSIRRGKKDK